MSNLIVQNYENEKRAGFKYKALLSYLKAGDILQISQATKANKKQVFVGICIAIYHKGLSSSLLLRNYLSGEAIEYRFYPYDKNIIEIKQVKQNKPIKKYRRSKLYYLRNRTPKESTVSI